MGQIGHAEFIRLNFLSMTTFVNVNEMHVHDNPDPQTLYFMPVRVLVFDTMTSMQLFQQL